MSKGQGVQASAELRNAVSQLFKRLGVTKTIEVLGVSREAASRLVADLPVRPGTIALVEARVAALGKKKEKA